MSSRPDEIDRDKVTQSDQHEIINAVPKSTESA